MSAPFIRPLTHADWSQYRDCRLRALLDSPDAFGSSHATEAALSDEAWRERLARGIDSPDAHPIVALCDGRAVGLTWARLHPDDAALAEVYQVWVCPSQRGRGVGAALLKEACDWARGRGARAMQLDVTLGDTSAMRLYLRAGFKTVGEPLPFRPERGLFSAIMRRSLSDDT